MIMGICLGVFKNERIVEKERKKKNLGKGNKGCRWCLNREQFQRRKYISRTYMLSTLDIILRSN
jgi:hypothetical protein